MVVSGDRRCSSGQPGSRGPQRAPPSSGSSPEAAQTQSSSLRPPHSLSSSHRRHLTHSISLSGLGSALFGGALWTGCARGSCRGKGGPACLLLLLVQATLDPRTGRGRRILGVTSFSCPADPKLWKSPQGLRVDTCHHNMYYTGKVRGGRATNGGLDGRLGMLGGALGKASPNTSQPRTHQTFPTLSFTLSLNSLFPFYAMGWDQKTPTCMYRPDLEAQP